LPSGAERGLLIHRAIELLGQNIDPDKARRLLGADLIDEDWGKILGMVEGFMSSLQEHFQPVALHWEVPITSRNRDGSVIGGTIDLLVETKDGFWIVDHKSDEPENLEETYNHYLPQLTCYAQALIEGMKFKLNGVAIHWACLGTISLSLGSPT
jgi:ATP-dependent exoDNAse (exonuclease V) beta subunit